ncbi:MAG: DNA repair protein RecN [Prevotella sp.]|nr:DNA repair protein RecN [Prevotella sp.]MDY4217763.1 DNA repair protein RecN [Prevotella sp.]
MLKHLYIKNFTIIDLLSINFHPGFSVISGETGAGKSIILGAIGLLLGNRADAKQIKQGEKKCTIEAKFDIQKYDFGAFFEENEIDYEPDETILRREINENGKSRAFINDTPVSLSLMRTIGEQLIDVHSQHQNLLLQKENFQLSVIDIIGKNADNISAYQQAYRQYKATEVQLEKLKGEIAKSIENEEFLRFQYGELVNAKLRPNLQDELEQESKTLSHAEEIKTALFDADNSLNHDEWGAVTMTKRAKDALTSITSVFPDAEELSKRLETLYIELKDIAMEVGGATENIDFDPSLLETINQQLDTIYNLEKKYKQSSVEELIIYRDTLEQQLQTIEHSDEEIKYLERQLKKHSENCEKLADVLTNVRTKAAQIIETEMEKRLALLGIPNVQFHIQLQEKETFAIDGKDKVQFLFSANKNAPLQPLTDVASGGEIARVMLSLKAMISGTINLPTIIFDEIDTGVSGKIAQQMAFVMQEMGNNNRQVIAITHLPQIAALGQLHYKVEKHDTDNGTTSQLRELSEEERVKEIAQMLSGADISEAAIQNAVELLKQKS